MSGFLDKLRSFFAAAGIAEGKDPVKSTDRIEKITVPPEEESGETEVLSLEPMLFKDLHEVYYIEQDVFSYHWTYMNFRSSVAMENQGWILRNEAGELLGYFIAMEVVDEMHLLKIAVAAKWQGHGYGRFLMDKAVALSRELKMESMLLEVRVSNKTAVGMYERTGFKPIGVRKGYYIDNHEDALVMRMVL